MNNNYDAQFLLYKRIVGLHNTDDAIEFGGTYNSS